MTWRGTRRDRRRGRRGSLVVLGLAAAVAVAGCSVLGLDTEGPVDATVVTSAAPAASVQTSKGEVVVPTLETGTSSGARSTPTPWESLLTTSHPPTTSEAPLTAPTTTRTTLTFKTFASITNPTVAAPTIIATPPPDCYVDGRCSPIDTASVGSKSLAVVNPDGGSDTVAVLVSGDQGVDAMSMARLGSPEVSCSGSYCLVQGTKSGVHFGRVVSVDGKHLTALGGSPVSASAMTLSGSGSSLMVVGAERFTDYGLLAEDAPIGARTWVLSGGALDSTGCGAPRLFGSLPSVTSAQSGPCSGTPRIAGYGSASEHQIVPLGGFVTPSGNIACAVVSGGKLACTAKQHDFSVKTCTKSTKEVPKGLRGLRVLLDSSGNVAHDGCLGYTLIGSPATKISYNRLAVGGGFVCEVQESGVTCTTKSGKGFVLSRSELTGA